MSRDQGAVAAVLVRAAPPSRSRHPPACPAKGPGGRARTRNPHPGRTRPPPPTHPLLGRR